jgi:hypothetical protein
MSTFTATATADTAPSVERSARAHPIRRTALATGAVAAVATTAVAAVAHGVGVPLAVDGEAIPLLGFAQMTLLGAVLGGLIAAALVHFSGSARRTFLAVAVVLTAASCIPSLALPPDGATKAVLVTAHLLAAAIIVPALARQTAR